VTALTPRELSDDERRALAALADDTRTPGRVAIRALIVLEASSGATRAQIADRLDVSTRTVTHWCARYRDDGMRGLRDRPRSGRPRTISVTARARAHGAGPPTASGNTSAHALQSSGHPVDGTLDRLLMAAIEVIASRGFGDTRVSDIAEVAGVSRASIHYYFRTKNEILIRALMWANERQLAHLAEVASETEDPVARLARFIERLIPYEGSVQAEEYLLEIDLWSRARIDPRSRPAWDRYSAQYVADAAALIADGVKAAVFKPSLDAEELAERIIGLTDALSIQSVVGASRMPAERVRTLILRFVAEQLRVPFEKLDALAQLPAMPALSRASPYRSGAAES
jgi:AcrR family transcriptional regulator